MVDGASPFFTTFIREKRGGPFTERIEEDFQNL